MTTEECDSLRSQIVILNGSGRGQHAKYVPKAFIEKGLYMLAAILKSPTATQTTLAIVETFAILREFSKIVTRATRYTGRNREESSIYTEYSHMRTELHKRISL